MGPHSLQVQPCRCPWRMSNSIAIETYRRNGVTALTHVVTERTYHLSLAKVMAWWSVPIFIQLLCFGHYPSSCCLFKTCFGDCIRSPSSGKNLLSWTQSTEQVPIPGEGGNRCSFLNVVFPSFLEYRTMRKVKITLILSVIHHRQNPLQSTWFMIFRLITILILEGSCFEFRGPRVQIWTPSPILTTVLRGFPQSHKENNGSVPLNRSWPIHWFYLQHTSQPRRW
jgi:hypothetical protein